jgi:hypothetical protein
MFGGSEQMDISVTDKEIGRTSWHRVLAVYAFSVLTSLCVFVVFMLLGTSIDGGLFFAVIAGFVFGAVLTAC